MTEPQRPVVQHQGPATHCVIRGHALGWLSCTCYAVAMAVDKATMGRKRPSGCDIRLGTNDVVGGTTLPQACGSARIEYGVPSEVRVGSNVATPTYVAGQLRAGRGVVVQGNAGAMLGTPFASTSGFVNHAVYVNEGRGWHTVGGVWLPTEVLVYDPAADGIPAGTDDSPSWWPWSLLLKFAALLRPWGDTDKRTLGPGKMYCALFADTEPHVHLAYVGSARTSPFPRVLTIDSPVAGRRVNERKGPSTKYAVVRALADGTKFIAFQQNAQGQLLAGSRLWYGDHNGTLWIHSSGAK